MVRLCAALSVSHGPAPGGFLATLSRDRQTCPNQKDYCNEQQTLSHGQSSPCLISSSRPSQKFPFPTLGILPMCHKPGFIVQSVRLDKRNGRTGSGSSRQVASRQLGRVCRDKCWFSLAARARGRGGRCLHLRD